MTTQRRSAAARDGGPAPVRRLTRRTAVTNAAFVASAEVVGKLSTLVWTVVVAQQLGQFGFGAFSLALAVGLLLAAVGEWGFDSVMVRRGSKDVSRLSQLFTEVVVWQLGLAAPMMLAGTVVFALVTPDRPAVAAFAMVLAAVLCDMVSDSARAAAAPLHRQGTTSAALITQRVVTAGAVIPAVLVWGDVVALAAAFLLSSVLGLVFHALALHRLRVRFRPRLVTVQGLRNCIRGTGYIGLSSMVQTLLYRAGFILLGLLVGQQEVGGYAAAHRLFETVLFLSYAVIAAVYPLMSVAESPARLRQLTEASVGILAGFYLPFAVVSLMEAPRLVHLVFGDDYVAGSTGALRWLAAAPLLFAVAYVGGVALMAVSATKRLLVARSTAAAGGIALYLVLIPVLGATGAAIPMTAALATDAVLTTVLLRSQLDRWPRYLRHAAPAVVCSVLVVAVLWVLDTTFLVELLVSATVYVVCWGSFLLWGRSGAARLVQALPGRDRGRDGR